MKNTPVGQSWVIRYRNKDETEGVGLTDHYSKLPFCIQLLLEIDATNITIEDETFYEDQK